MRSATAGGRVRLTTTRGGPVVRGRQWRRGIGRQRDAHRRQRHGAGDRLAVAVDERHVDGPVGAARLAELPGAVERVDDPDPVGAQSRPVLDALLGQDLVVRPQLAERLDDEPVGRPVALVPQRPPVVRRRACLRPQVEQQLAGPRGHVRRDGVVGEHGGRR